MKRLIAILLLISISASCIDRTQYGECIGAFDEGDPKLRYSISGWNVAMGINLHRDDSRSARRSF